MSRVFGGRLITGSAVTGLTVFAVGAVVAALADFPGLYFHTRAIYIGVAGIAWVTCWGGWADRSIRAALRVVPEAFVAKAGKDDADRNIATARKWLFSRRVHLGVSAVVWALAAIYIGLRASGIGRKQSHLFPDAWLNGRDEFAKAVTLVVFAAPIVALCVTMIFGAVAYLWLVRKLSEQDLVMPVEVARFRLRRMAGWGVRCGVGWSIALTTLVLFFGHNIRARTDGSSLAAVVTFTVLGVWAPLLFLWPQYFFHRALLRSNFAVHEAAIRANRLGVPTRPPNVPYLDYVKTALDNPATPSLQARLRHASAASEWVYGAPTDFMLFVGQAVLPIIAVFVRL